MMVELRQYRYFLAIAEESSFTRAAERLRMAQPPLSQQMAKMERELGVRLFTRHGRGIELTPAGRALLAETYGLLEQEDRARSRARRVGGSAVGLVRVAAMPSIFTGFLPGALDQVRSRLPGVDLRVQELDEPEQVAALVERRIDVGVGRSVRLPGTLTVRRVGEESVFVALPVDHLAARRTAVRLSDLADDAFVLFPRQRAPETYDTYVAACVAAGFSPRVEQEAVGDHTMLGMVACRLGVALVPSATRRVRVDGVVYRPLSKGSTVRLPVCVAWRTTSEPLGVDALCETLHEQIRHLQEQTRAMPPSGNRAS